MDTAEIERELDDLETRIDRLRALYEQYFLGIEKMEPSIPRRDAERKIQILRKEQVRNTAQRFKFQMLVQRYNTMQQHWARVTREIENGTYRRDVLRAAARFGEKEALTILGKKRQKQYSVLAEAQALALRKRRGGSEDDELELSDSDLLVDDDIPQQSAAVRALISSDDPGSSERKGQLGGLRWSGKSPGDPASAVRSTEAQTGVKRRLAELAAAMKAPAAPLDDDDEDPPTLPPRAASTPIARSGVRPESPGFGALDLDFDESASAPLRKPVVMSTPLGGAAIQGSPGARLPAAPSASALRPITPSDPGGPRTPAPFSPRTPVPFSPRTPAPVAPQAPSPSAPRAPSPSFGTLDLPFEAPPPAAPQRRPLPAPPAPPRASIPPAPHAPLQATPLPRAAPVPAAEPPAPSAPVARPPAAATDGALPDQRLRQIYAKYVEAKRSANESTAGVTYEKLAETLRAQASRLKASHPAKSIDYDVIIKDGKTLLKPVLR
jgi:hypothetical protein